MGCLSHCIPPPPPSRTKGVSPNQQHLFRGNLTHSTATSTPWCQCYSPTVAPQWQRLFRDMGCLSCHSPPSKTKGASPNRQRLFHGSLTHSTATSMPWCQCDSPAVAPLLRTEGASPNGNAYFATQDVRPAVPPPSKTKGASPNWQRLFRGSLTHSPQARHGASVTAPL